MKKYLMSVLSLSIWLSGCSVAVNAGGSRTDGTATEASLMQADRDFATATHARGIDGWMSFYAPDAIRIRYRGDMVKRVRRDQEVRRARHLRHHDRSQLGANRCARFPRWHDWIHDRAIHSGQPQGRRRREGAIARPIRDDVAAGPRKVARYHGHGLPGAGRVISF
jgi:hypothetical protein